MKLRVQLAVPVPKVGHGCCFAVVFSCELFFENFPVVLRDYYSRYDTYVPHAYDVVFWYIYSRGIRDPRT